MKLQILNTEGKKVSEKETKLFEEPVREDIIFKVIEVERMNSKREHPYAPKPYAGMGVSRNARHKRHSWKSDRGRGISRIPKKTFWRRGTQFAWEGATVPFARGGRRAHPPKVETRIKKINKKELKKALLSCLTYVSNVNNLKKKYNSLNDKKIEINLPLVVESSILKLKTKDFFNSLKKVLNELYEIAIQKKSVRAGIGKRRGRKYKKSAGLLFIIGRDEDKKISGIDVVKTNNLKISDLASGGARLTLFSEQAVKELENILFENKKVISKNNKKTKKRKADENLTGQQPISKLSESIPLTSNKILEIKNA